jgi:hypothetical protein
VGGGGGVNWIHPEDLQTSALSLEHDNKLWFLQRKGKHLTSTKPIGFSRSNRNGSVSDNLDNDEGCRFL